MSHDHGIEKRSGTLPASLEAHRLLNTKQLSEATGYCPEHIRRLTREGKFPKPVRIGRLLLWPASVLVEIATGQHAQPEKAA